MAYSRVGLLVPPRCCLVCGSVLDVHGRERQVGGRVCAGSWGFVGSFDVFELAVRLLTIASLLRIVFLSIESNQL